MESFFFLASLFVESICSCTSDISLSKFISERRIFTDSAPIPAENSSPNSSSFSKYSSSSKIWPFSRSVMPGSVTTKDSKYKILSTSLRVLSKRRDILEGRDFKNQICATGAASSICPILSLLTLASVTSTPHFSHTTPLCFILLYLPQIHS